MTTRHLLFAEQDWRSVKLFLAGVKSQGILQCAVYSLLCSVQYVMYCAVPQIVSSTPYSVQYSVQNSELFYGVIFLLLPSKII